MKKISRILNQSIGDGRTEAEKREAEYQRAEGMVEPGSSVQRRREERDAQKSGDDE
ncbi:hypothetical protein ACWEOE_31820 [Amycolatopsis sp. NPDC004368]